MQANFKFCNSEKSSFAHIWENVCVCVCIWWSLQIFEWIEHNQRFTFGSDFFTHYKHKSAHFICTLLFGGVRIHIETKVVYYTNTNNDQDSMSIFQKSFWWWQHNVNYRYSFIFGHRPWIHSIWVHFHLSAHIS